MKKIYKYNLFPTDIQALNLPIGSKILSVEEQYGNIVLYALVETAPEFNFEDSYVFLIKGTGHICEEDLSEFNFLNTVKLQNGALIFHIFYKKD